jgi:hypothetical protein
VGTTEVMAKRDHNDRGLTLRLLGVASLLLAGCATPPSSPAPGSPASAKPAPPSIEGRSAAPSAPSAAKSPARPTRPDSSPVVTDQPPTEPETPPVVAAADEQLVEIVSVPVGARVLVNNQPVGRTPLQVPIKVTSQGFCSDYVTVKVRFIAEDATQVSQTLDAELTPRLKPPSSLNFTPTGVQWHVR